MSPHNEAGHFKADIISNISRRTWQMQPVTLIDRKSQTKIVEIGSDKKKLLSIEV